MSYEIAWMEVPTTAYDRPKTYINSLIQSRRVQFKSTFCPIDVRSLKPLYHCETLEELVNCKSCNTVFLLTFIFQNRIVNLLCFSYVQLAAV